MFSDIFKMQYLKLPGLELSHISTSWKLNEHTAAMDLESTVRVNLAPSLFQWALDTWDLIEA